MRLPQALALLLTGFSIALPPSALAATEVSHAIALRSTPKYPAGFDHFDYVNPKAPKGGDVRLVAIGTFDSLNSFIDKGNPAEGLDMIYDSLTVRSLDEPGSYYGLLAEKIERDPADNSWIIYDLNPKARFSDGAPVTADDVVFSFDTVRHDGNPGYKMYYQDIVKVEALNKTQVKFTFRSKNNPELPIIVGELQILPRHYWAKHSFTSGSLDIPVGSGPYTITRVDAGHSITYTRNASYWARDLPVNRGLHNFNSETFTYYRDGTVGLEGFKAGKYDFRAENKAKSWAVDYDFPALKNGFVKKLEQPNQNPAGMQAFVYNLRKPQFQDRRVREALGYAFDFEWENKTLFYGSYQRTESYYSNSDLAATGLPSKEELAILEPFRAQVPPEVFTTPYQAPHTDGSGNNRQNLLKAQQLLTDAGWTMKNNVLTDKNGQPLSFEILLVQPEFERIVQPFAQNLSRLGVQAKVRVVDDSQYIERLKKFDFDMVVGGAGQSLSPGNEQRSFFGSKSADAPNSRNLAGIKNPVVDALIEQLIAAPTRTQLVFQTRALDRVLLWNHYMIPQYHAGIYRLAYWDFFERPALAPKYDAGFDTWWVDPQKLAKIRTVQGSGK
jgi:microcin C transport system substrate-binding protein